MDQIKIGKFIAARRKSVHLTQAQLGEKLGISDRAVSKWETGKSMPDSSLMLELCEILEITVNDLLTGEVVSMENYNKEMEKNLMEMVKQKEESDRKLLLVEIAMGVASIIPCFAILFIAAYMPMENWLRAVLIAGSAIVFIAICLIALRIEQVAGYYECQECKHRYIPKFGSVLCAMHVNRTRYMKCPKCDKKSWQKKVISLE